MINRSLYMEQLLTYRDKEQVKVITGMRRSGKSTLISTSRALMHAFWRRIVRLALQGAVSA